MSFKNGALQDLPFDVKRMWKEAVMVCFQAGLNFLGIY
jgi:hypothetical protein